jgi:hypothetical protein
MVCNRPGRSGPISEQGRAGVVAKTRPGAVEVADDAGTGQADRSTVAAGGSEPPGEIHVSIQLQAVRLEARARVVAQPRSLAIEAAADARGDQVDRAVVTAAGGRELVA